MDGQLPLESAGSNEPAKKTKTQMSHADFYRLCEWLRRNGNEVLAMPTSYWAIAKQGAEALELPKVSEYSVGQALEATGMIKKYLPKSAVKPSKLNPDSCAILAKHLAFIYTNANVPVPPDLAALLDASGNN